MKFGSSAIHAILPFDEFVQLQGELQDFEDLKTLRIAKKKEKNTAGFALSEAKKELNI